MSSNVTNILGGIVQPERQASVALQPGMFIEAVSGKVRPATQNTGELLFADNSFDGSVMRGDTYAIDATVPFRKYVSGNLVNGLLAVGESVSKDDALTGNGAGGLKACDASVAATLATGSEASNNAITWTAAEGGEDGNNIAVKMIDPGSASASLSVSVEGLEVQVSLATDGSSDISSTAAEVIAAVAADSATSLLVSAANTGDSDGSGIVEAVASTQLSGGVNAETDNPLFFADEAIDNSDGTALVDIKIRIK